MDSKAIDDIFIKNVTYYQLVLRMEYLDQMAPDSMAPCVTRVTMNGHAID